MLILKIVEISKIIMFLKNNFIIKNDKIYKNNWITYESKSGYVTENNILKSLYKLKFSKNFINKSDIR